MSTQRTLEHRTPLARRRTLGPAVGLALALVAAACSVTVSPGPIRSGAPGSSVPSAGTIAHTTGAADVILRLEVGGGFVPIGWLVTQAPTVTLYGDGVVLFRGAATPQPSPLGTVIRSNPFQTGRMTEAQVQDLLAFALDAGGLRTARVQYDPGNVADAPSTLFTINAGGVARTVTVVALGIGTWKTDKAAVDGLSRLADRLNAIDQSVTLSGTYSPARYRTILQGIDAASAGSPREWPFASLTPADWTLPGDVGRPAVPTRILAGAEIAVLGIAGSEGGFQGLRVKGPDGKTYALAARPLLPDEAG